MTRLVIIFLLWTPILCFAKDQVVAINGVSINREKCLAAPRGEELFSCHRFNIGEGFGVAFRSYQPPKHTDADFFEKFTILFKRRPLVGQIFVLPSNEVFAFNSSGSSSFPGRGGCYGEANGGHIKITGEDKRSIRVAVDLQFDATSTSPRKNQCNGMRFNKKLNALVIDSSKLNPWYGKDIDGANIWYEARP